MEGRKHKWRWMLLFSVIVVMLTITVFWDSLIMFAVPKVVLPVALTDAFAMLKTRFGDSPLWILANGYDPDGGNTIQMQVAAKDGAVGDIACDLVIQADADKHCLSANGVVTIAENRLNLQAYVDNKFVALSSEELLDGGYYGITYDSFDADIRSFPFVDFLIPSSTILKWEDSLKNLRAFVNNSYVMPQIPDITEEDIRMLTLGLLTLKSDTAVEKVTIDGRILACYKVTYSVSGSQIRDILQYFLESDDLEDCTAVISFYLYDKNVIKADISVAAGAVTVDGSIFLGLDAKSDALAVTVSWVENGAEDSTSVVIDTVREGERYCETLCINNVPITYEWTPASGDMLLYVTGEKLVRLILTPVEYGFRIRTNDLPKLLGMEDQHAFDCTMTVTPGATVTTPSYKNLSQWSWEDLIALLDGVGTLVSFQ